MASQSLLPLIYSYLIPHAPPLPNTLPPLSPSEYNQYQHATFDDAPKIEDIMDNSRPSMLCIPICIRSNARTP